MGQVTVLYQCLFCFLYSGGLLVCMAAPQAKAYCEEVEIVDGRKAWIIGDVIKGPREARLSENVEIIEV